MLRNNAIRLIISPLHLCRLIALFVTVFIVQSLERKEKIPEFYPFWFTVYLATGTLLFFILSYKKNHWGTGVIFILDYIAVLLFQYYEPHYIFLELVWLPVILLSISVIFPVPHNFWLTAVMGIPGYLILSYFNYTKMTVIIGENNYSCYHVSLLYVIPVTLLSIGAGLLNYYLENYKSKITALQRTCEHLNIVNREISKEIFILKEYIGQEERKRISKQIHDIAGYVFINLIMMLQAALAVFHKDSLKAENLINDARNYAERGINEIRYILQQIRNYIPGFISLQNSLFDTVNLFEKATSVEISLEYGNWPRTFNEKINSFFISFLQECLTNALKHGQATRISIKCWKHNDDISMSIRDNGIGCVLPLKNGIGISSMEEYIDAKGGSLAIHSDGYGFRITCTIPFCENDRSDLV